MAKIPKFPRGKEPKELLDSSRKRPKKRKVNNVESTSQRKRKSSEARRPKTKKPRFPSTSDKSKKKRKKRIAHPLLTRTRANVKATIKRAEQRGYKFSDNIKEFVRDATLDELNWLRASKYKELYKAATYTTESGSELGGTEARILEQQRSIQKGVETRRRNKLIKKYGEEYVLKMEARKATDALTDIYEEPDELYNEPEVIENEPTFNAEERARQAEFERRKDEESYKIALDLGDVAWDTIKDIVSDYSKMGAGRFGQYFTDLMKYYEKTYSVDVIKYAISMVYEDYLEIAQDILFYNNNINELINSVNNLKRLIDKALTYSGLTPDFQWKMSFDELKDKETLDFLSNEEYPY